MKVVLREKLEMWCSEDCAERAMYLRVQLAEEPVWERRAAASMNTKQFVLLDEARQKKKVEAAKQGDKSTEDYSDAANASTAQEDHALNGKMATLTVNEEKPSSTKFEHAKQLALERGDSGPAMQASGRVDVSIREKDVTFNGDIPSAPVSNPQDRTGGSIEGYVPKQKTQDQLKHESREENDVLDNI